MSKYKLVKEFPLSPGIGFIADFTKVRDSDCIYDVGAISNLFECDCKDWSEFWEEIIEKEWEIVDEYHYNMMVVSCSLNTILSIKRLSDNIVFSVGDKIEHHYKDNPEIVKIYTIEKIYTLEDGSLRFYVGNGLNLGLERLKKYSPKVVFTTEDGVEVNSDRKIFGVSLSDNVGYKAYDLTEHEYKYNSSINLIGFKWFIDKGKAIIYIDLNKPQYSKKDIIESCFECGYSSIVGNITYRLKEKHK